ncbi:MAG: PKD domain-containing protein [Bacteroidota bacterium]
MSNQHYYLSFLIVFLIIGPLNAQVTVDFDASRRSGCGSFQVNFLDQSSSTEGPIVSWRWDLSGVIASSQNPGRVFGRPGRYNICLTVTDAADNVATRCESSFIVVYELPEPDFTVNFTEGCSPMQVVFEDMSMTQDAPIAEWIWGLGGSSGVVVDDGTLPSISSTYTIPDSYTISLTVRDTNGCINTLTEPDFLTLHQDPRIDISADQTFQCEPPLSVQFTNHNPEGNVTYHWNFGNGLTFTGPQPPLIEYSEHGVYDVQLIAASGATGCTDTLFLESYIEVGRPAQIIASTNSACLLTAVNFTEQGDTPADSLRWNFGDGQSSTNQRPSHLYQNPGCYTVSLTRWVNGCENTITLDSCVRIHPLPELDYTSTDTIGCSLPHTATFNGLSNNAVAWEWDFGDQNTSDRRNPQHQYTSFGNYPVTLTVTNAMGCQSSIIKNTINIQPMEARVVGDRFYGCTPLSLNLQDQSQSITPIVSWDWQLSTASLPPSVVNSTDQNPGFTLVDTGRYDIRLIVENSLGCRDTSLTHGMIGVGTPPVSDFDIDPPITCVKSIVFFTDQSSSFADEWLWDFGDGTESDLQSPTHEYKDTGIYEVRLTTFYLGCQNEQEFTIPVDIQPPIANYVINRECDRPYDVSLRDISVGATRVLWDFGIDGVEEDTSTIRQLTYTYPTTGSYFITLVAFNDSTGCRDTTKARVIITDPKADFSLSTQRGCVPLQVDMIDRSEFARKYSWSSGGGSWSSTTAAEPSLTFNTGGTYQDVQLVVTDVNGCRDSMLIRDTIWANAATADFELQPAGGCRPLEVQLTDQSSDLFGEIVSWNWTIDNGFLQSNDTNPVITIPDAGLYDVTLVVHDDWGCEGRRGLDNIIEVTQPIAHFSADTAGCTRQEIFFVNTSEGDSLTYHWDFGDGTFSTEPIPRHFYAQEGTYTVCLTASNQYGCDSTFCRPNYVTIADPIANFTVDQAYANCPPLIVNFENLSQNTRTYIWDFGDASGTSTLENPPHVYTVPGFYDVRLIAAFNEYCQDTLIISEMIQLDGPVGSFSFDIDSSCVPVAITFKGESREPYDYIWDFGNGILDTTLQVAADSLVYTYTEAGKFIPQLILVNSDECHRAIVSPDTIHLATLFADFINSRPILCGPKEASFINISRSTENITSFHWTFPGTQQGSSQVAEPIIFFDSVGQYDVQLIIDNGFCQDTFLKPKAIQVGAVPHADFAVSDSIACWPQRIDFTDHSQIEQDAIVEWEWQFGNGSTSLEQNPSLTYDTAGQYTVQLQVSTALNCQSTTSNEVRILPRPGSTTGTYPEICIGESLQVNAALLSDSTTFHWMDHPGLSCIDCLDPIINIPLTTTFYLITENNHACRDTTSLTINVGPHPVPTITISEDTTTCLNDPVQLFVSGGYDVNSYQWNTDDPGLSCYTSCSNPIATPLESTTYQVTVSNEFGCRSRDSVRVNILDQFQSFTSPDRTICVGDSVHLSLSTGNEPVWLVSEGLDCTYCPNPVATPDETTTYQVRVTTDNGCEIYDSLTLTVVDPESIDAGEDTLICLGEVAPLAGQGLGLIRWSPEGSLDDASQLNPEALPIASTMYYLRATEGECELLDSVWVEVIEKADIQARDTTICEGESVELQASGLADHFTWLPSSYLSIHPNAHPLASPPSTRPFSVVGHLQGCEPDTAHLTVEVLPAPNVDLPPLYRFFEGQLVKFKVTPADSNGYHYRWIDPVGFSCSSCPAPALRPTETTEYRLVVSNPKTRCLDTISTTAQMMQSCPEDLISVPNVFTPNGDGNNEELGLYPAPAIEAITRFQIYNRWGSLVFETTDLYDTWDGTVRGRPAPQGVYLYVLEAPCQVIDGQLMKTGDITLLR